MARADTTRCVLLFTRNPGEEGRAKSLTVARPLFEYSRRRVESSVASLPGVDLVVVGASESSSLQAVARALPQRGGSFGERLQNAFDDVRAAGYREIVAVSGDVPALSQVQIARAFQLLVDREVVLGPSPDGGVYLIGVRCEVRALFLGVNWRTSTVLARLLENAPAAALIEPLGDVDRWDDLAALRREERLPTELVLLLRAILASPGPPRETQGIWPRSYLLTLQAFSRGPPTGSGLSVIG